MRTFIFSALFLQFVWSLYQVQILNTFAVDDQIHCLIKNVIDNIIIITKRFVLRHLIALKDTIILYRTHMLFSFLN